MKGISTANNLFVMNLGRRLMSSIRRVQRRTEFRESRRRLHADSAKHRCDLLFGLGWPLERLHRFNPCTAHHADQRYPHLALLAQR
jgi:hypothetical protein